MKSNIQRYIEASYLYYERGESVMLDSEFDKLAVDLLTNWDSIEDPYKHLLDESMLRMGTGFDIEYPEELKQSALEYLKDYKESIAVFLQYEEKIND